MRREFHHVAARARVRRRFAPHQLCTRTRSSSPEGAPLSISQRQLGHTNLGTAPIYPQRIDPVEILVAVHAHRAPKMPASAGLQL